MKRRERGFSLIETLVSLALSSIGVMAMTELSGMALRYMRSSELRIEASWLAADLAERMQANTAGLAAYALTPAELASQPPDRAPTCARPHDCEPAELAALDLAAWQHRLQTQLPAGTGYVQLPGPAGGAVRLWVMWRDPVALSGTANSPLGHYLNPGSAGMQCPPGFGQGESPPRCLLLELGV